MPSTRTSTHRSVEKALEVLLAFVPNNKETGTIELSRKLGLHKSTISRILHVLMRYGFVQQDPKKKTFSLGKSAADLGQAVRQSLRGHLVLLAQPHLDRLRDLTGETIALEVLIGDSTILAYKADGPQAVRVSPSLGDRMPVHVAAGAKAILAFSPPEFVDSVLPKELTRFTPNTITDPKVLKKRLAEFRELGVAFDRCERDIDVSVLAAPIFNHNKRPVAAVVCPIPAYRMNPDLEAALVPKLKETASLISKQLLYSAED